VSANPETETKSFLTVQGERMREELMKAGEKVREIPQVKRALELYDEQMEKLRQAMDTDAAKKIFELLTKAKEAVIQAIEAAQNSPMGQAVVQKVNDVQSQAQVKIEELKAKAGMSKPASSNN